MVLLKLVRRLHRLVKTQPAAPTATSGELVRLFGRGLQRIYLFGSDCQLNTRLPSPSFRLRSLVLPRRGLLCITERSRLGRERCSSDEYKEQRYG